MDLAAPHSPQGFIRTVHLSHHRGRPLTRRSKPWWWHICLQREAAETVFTIRDKKIT